jgi:hypothetical protein
MLKVVVVLFFLLAGSKSGASSFAQGLFSGNLPMLQGLTDSQSTQFSILVPKSSNYIVRIRPLNQQNYITPSWRHLETRPFSDLAILKVAFTNLQFLTDYQIEVMDSNLSLVDLRFFGLVDVNKAQAKVALGSCIQEKYQNFGVWEALVLSRPDYLFMVGDTVYADRIWQGGDDDDVKPADPVQLWNQYTRYFKNIIYYKSLRLIPTLATWDDHDYGINNGDGTYPYKSNALRVFHTMFAQNPDFSASALKGPGVSFAFVAFGQNYLFLDDRSFKAPIESDLIPYLFGPIQHEFMFGVLAQSTRPTWMISGMPFFGAYNKKESLEGDYPEAHHFLMKQFSQFQAPIAFISGDTHFSEIMAIEEQVLGYPTLEITASSIHSYTRDKAGKKKNPRRLHWFNGHNIITLETQTQGVQIMGRVQSLSEGSTLNFSQDFQL